MSYPMQAAPSNRLSGGASGKRGKKLVSQLTGFFLSLELGLSGTDRITSRKGG